jgi:hypothetical protein
VSPARARPARNRFPVSFGSEHGEVFIEAMKNFNMTNITPLATVMIAHNADRVPCAVAVDTP